MIGQSQSSPQMDTCKHYIITLNLSCLGIASVMCVAEAWKSLDHDTDVAADHPQQ